MIRSGRRSPPRFFQQPASNRGSVTTLLGAMTTRAVVAKMAVEVGTSTDVFESFLRDVLLPQLDPGTTVVMDNLGAHRAKRIAALLHDHGVRVRFSPPYSPPCNPIEMIWGWLKARLRTWQARTVQMLDDAVGRAMQELPPEIAAAWAAHAGYRRKCA